ncbi:MAG: ATP-dependent helicase [Lentisphaeraceae bacterium]|nr:ATP-dependent helicase [Lentisphaeraceae bacterium]
MLNEAQVEVTKHLKGALLVIAGAGTGKTRTLIHRYVKLIESGVPLHKILLLTFTRKAAHEMHERALSLLQNHGLNTNIDQIGGTFHSVAFKWLRILGIMKSGFSIVDEKDLKKLVNLDLPKEEKALLTQLCLTVANVLQIRSLMINLQVSVDEVISRFFPAALSYYELIKGILARLDKRKKDGDMNDYDDILNKWLQTLKSEQGDAIRKAYDYVMVDEYQDTSKVQVEILKELVNKHENIMAVGDDCQSIYSFRGALADQMMEFTKDFSQSKIVKLEHNYRSSQAILDMCNDVISGSTEVYPKELQSANDLNGPEPKLVSAHNEQETAYRILETVMDNLNRGIPLNQQAVLFRSTVQVQSLERILVKERIPYKKYGGIKITEAAHLKDFMSLISCCFCSNTTAWLRTLEMVPGIGAKKAVQVLNMFKDKNLNFAKFPENARERLEGLFAIVNSKPDDRPEESFIEACVKWYKTYLFDHYDNANSRFFELENLCGELLNVESLNEFAAEILLDKVETEEDEYESNLILSTIHSAKGKEWDCVYIVNVANGAIPLKRSSVDFEEERRLLYVAMTRARERLYLYRPKFKNFENTPTNLSPFLKVVERKDYNIPVPGQNNKNNDEPDDLIYVYDDSGIF